MTNKYTKALDEIILEAATQAEFEFDTNIIPIFSAELQKFPEVVDTLRFAFIQGVKFGTCKIMERALLKK